MVHLRIAVKDTNLKANHNQSRAKKDKEPAVKDTNLKAEHNVSCVQLSTFSIWSPFHKQMKKASN